jgi:hypothetical protein
MRDSNRLQRQENWDPLLGTCGNFSTGLDMAGTGNRVYLRMRLARFHRTDYGH